MQTEYLAQQGAIAATGFALEKIRNEIVEILYNEVKHTVSESKDVLVKLKENYPLVLVSNFYGNIEVVLSEFQLDGIFQEIIESAVVKVRNPTHASMNWASKPSTFPLKTLSWWATATTKTSSLPTRLVVKPFG